MCAGGGALQGSKLSVVFKLLSNTQNHLKAPSLPNHPSSVLYPAFLQGAPFCSHPFKSRMEWDGSSLLIKTSDDYVTVGYLSAHVGSNLKLSMLNIQATYYPSNH